MDSVAAAVVNTRPSCSVVLAPTVIAAADIMVPLNVVSAARVVAPPGTQNTLVLAVVAPPVNATIALAAVSNVESVRKM